MSVNAATMIAGIFTKAGYTGSFIYSEDKEELKDAALDASKTIIKTIEKDYDKNNLEGNAKRGCLDYAEMADLLGSKWDKDQFDEMDLDGKSGITAEELASYLMAADALKRQFDEKYAGWEFLPDADIEEDDLNISVYIKDLADGEISEDNLNALAKMKNSDLQEAAKEIYDNNFAKKENPIVAFFKNLFS